MYFSFFYFIFRFLAGAAAGSVTQFAVYPLEIAKTRLSLCSKGHYNGIFDCIYRVSSQEGLKGIIVVEIILCINIEQLLLIYCFFFLYKYQT